MAHDVYMQTAPATTPAYLLNIFFLPNLNNLAQERLYA